MSLSEIVLRIRDQAFLLRLRWQHQMPPAELPPEPPGSHRNPEFRVGDVALDMPAIASDYASLLEGELHYGGGDWHFDDEASAWHREHTTLRDWPQKFFNTLDFRPGNPVGDARRTWEPARLQQLVALAVRSRDLGLDQHGAHSKFAVAMIERQLVSWWRHNPPMHGIHYVSAMECGLRCIAVSHAASLLESRGRLSATVRAVSLAMLSQHAVFIRQRLSTHSSAGNHTLAECAGLIVACLIVPDRPDARLDEHFATELFAQELDRQVVSDGGGLEQATWYHRFNIELGECVSATLKANNRPVPNQITDALERGGRFLRAVNVKGTEFVRIGDADDGYALSRYHVGRWRSLPLTTSVQHFKETGISCIQRNGWKVIAQYGPLGMAPSFGHGHADALSLLVSVDGVEVLCDSGTGAYSGESARLRERFRSCTAHNTVQVGSGDFARVLSPFMWSHPYQCQLLHEHSDDDTVELWMKLSVHVTAPFRVYRYVHLARNALTIIDRIDATSTSSATQRWHFPFGLVRVDPSEPRFEPDAGAGLLIDLDKGTSIQCQAGQRSVSYGELEAVTTLSQESAVFVSDGVNTDGVDTDGVNAGGVDANRTDSNFLSMRLTRSASGNSTNAQDYVATPDTLKNRAQEYFA